jgi:hypothetical protein
MKQFIIAIPFLVMAWVTGHAETVYKYQNPDGTMSYSDRPEQDVTSTVEKVQLPAGPSDAEQRAANERLEQMQQSSAAMEQSRLANEEALKRQNAVEDAIDPGGEAVGSSTVVDRRFDPKRRIPVESPSGGEHPIYSPGIGPGNAPGIARPAAGAPGRGR